VDENSGELDQIFCIFDDFKDVTVPQPELWAEIVTLIPYLSVLISRHQPYVSDPAEKNALALCRCLRDALILHRDIQRVKAGLKPYHD
jgi:hypothetical protein